MAADQTTEQADRAETEAAPTTDTAQEVPTTGSATPEEPATPDESATSEVLSEPATSGAARQTSSAARTSTSPSGGRRLAAAGLVAAVLAAVFAIAGYLVGSSQTNSELLLGGPSANIVVTIPDGWHQVINSVNPVIPQMVAPTDCMGRNEVGCATGLARVATLTAPSQADAVRAVSQALTSERGVTRGPTLTEGPAKVGQIDGYRQRFTYRNPRAQVTAEVAAVPSGSVAPDQQGNREFSVVLAWVNDQPGAPPITAIDEIVTSTRIPGGAPPP